MRVVETGLQRMGEMSSNGLPREPEEHQLVGTVGGLRWRSKNFLRPRPSETS